MRKIKKQSKAQAQPATKELSVRELEKVNGGFWDSMLCTDDGDGWSGSPVSHSSQLCTDDGSGWSGGWW